MLQRRGRPPRGGLHETGGVWCTNAYSSLSEEDSDTEEEQPTDDEEAHFILGNRNGYIGISHITIKIRFAPNVARIIRTVMMVSGEDWEGRYSR